MKVALLLEGPGDLAAFPHMVGKISAQLGKPIFASSMIRTGGYHKLKKPGELERYVKLGASRDDIELIVVAVDLDDGCAASAKDDFNQRLAAISLEIGKPVEVAFCVREYESWFLENLHAVRLGTPEYAWREDFNCTDPASKRDAKGLLNSAMTKHYKEIIDQPKLTKSCDLKFLYANSRSFRRFVKAISLLNYKDLDIAF